jgi:hypothetical protein
MVGAFVVGASGCGSDGGHFDGKSPAEIAEESRKSMLDLTAMTMTAEFTDAESTTKISSSFTLEGECNGTIAMDDAEAEFLSVGGSTYFKANDAFWNQDGTDGAALNAVTAGRWITMPEGQSGYDQFCALDSFLSSLEDGETEDDEWKAIDGQKINGTSTVGVSRTEDDGTTKMYVADSKDAYIIRMDREGDEEGQANFSDFNKKFDFSAPADGEIVDPAELENMG